MKRKDPLNRSKLPYSSFSLDSHHHHQPKNRIGHLPKRFAGKIPKEGFLLCLLLGSLTLSSFLRNNNNNSSSSVTASSLVTSHVRSSSSSSSSSKTIACPRYQFASRTADETIQFEQSWQRAVRFVLARQLTFLLRETLEFHKSLLQSIEENGVQGMILECGVAKAGSSITFAAYKHPERCLHLFDTFEGIPPPSAKDGKDAHDRYQVIASGKAGENYYGYMKDLMAFDQEQFVQAGFDLVNNKHNIHFHKGLFNETVWPIGPVAYAHLDGDWYESTYGMLERIEPFLQPGGYFVLDDVYNFSGASTAFEDFFQIDVNALRLQVGPCLAVRQSKGTTIMYELMFGAKAAARRIANDRPKSDLPKLCPVTTSER